MAAIAGQIVEPASNLLRGGPESGSTLLRHSAASVSYVLAGTRFTDTIPADGTHNVAAQYGSAAAIDITLDTYVTFIVCQSGGVAQLACTPERNWPIVVALLNVVPLDFVHTTGVGRYQLSSGGGAGGGGGAGDASGAAITFVMSASAGPIPTGVKGALVVPFVCTITAAYLIADVASTSSVDIGKATYSTYPTSSSIVASAPPALAGADKSLDTALAGWTTALAAGDVLTFTLTANSAATELSVVLLVQRPTALEWVIDGDGAVIATGITGSLTVPFPCVLSSVTLLADAVGSIVVDIWKCDYASYPPTSASTICAGTRPTIAGAQKSQDTALSGWTTALAAGDILVFDAVSASVIQRCSVILMVQRT